METSPCRNSVAGHQITTNFCTCHDSTAVVPCTKFCSDHGIGVEVRVKRNFHRIWIAMEKPLVKRGPGRISFETWLFSNHKALNDNRRTVCANLDYASTLVFSWRQMVWNNHIVTYWINGSDLLQCTSFISDSLHKCFKLHNRFSLQRLVPWMNPCLLYGGPFSGLQVLVQVS